MTITSDPAEQVVAPRMQQSLFGLIPTASDGRQWTARSMQLVSWGGYHGYHEVRFAGTTTLLTGASGSGKSTLLDAYIALMMSHTTPFNGASNTATSGRARGQEQRNVVSYARGKLDEERTAGSARAKDRVLRGETSDTWSAIAMTWSSQAGERFTALRAWYVPRGAQRTDETVAVRAVVDADFSLRDLEPLAAQRFGKAGLTAAGLTSFDTDKAFATRLHAALGIGAAGDGEKAMQLLGRIQAGQQITTVDSLYKAMVLEEPETIRVAERAVEHFDELSEVRAEMDTAQRQVDVLRPMLEHRAAVDDAVASARLVDALGPDGGAGGGEPGAVTPFTAWRDRTQLDLLRAGEAENRAQHKAAAERVAVAEERLAAAQGELEQVRADQRRNGGDAIEAAERDVRAAEQRLAETRRARAELDGHLAPLEREASSRRELDALHADARRYLDERDTHTDALSEAVVEASAREKEAMRALAELEREEASLKARRGNVPRELHEAREALARAAGLRPDDVPFVGELLEVRGEYEPWRDAIGLALGGFAVTVLVDETRLDAFRAAIDAVRSPVRVRFEGVPTGQALHEEADRTLLPGRLEVKAGPFGGWLAGRLAERFAYVCVDDPTELARHDLALARSGQTSEGRRGAHGGQGRASVLGFSNHRRLEQLAEQIAAAHQELRQASEALAGARLRQKGEADHFVAYSHALRAAWDDLDVRGAEARLGERQERHEALVAGSDVLRALKADEDALRAGVDELYRERAAAQQRVTELGAAWEQLSDQVDQVADAVERADDEGVEPTPEQERRLAGLMAQVGWSGVAGTSGSGLADLTTAVAAVVRELHHQRESAQETERAARAALAALFERFNDTWPDPNRSADPDGAYADFLRIYEELEYQQLYRLRDRWSAHLRQMSGDQLTRLNNGIAQAVAEIRDRMEPVNAILATLPFRDDAHRLRITATPVEASDVVSFRRRLRELATAPAGDVPLAEHERRYERMRRLIDRIRPDSPERRRLVDVREHVRVSAECVDLEGNHVSVYDHIAGKSGGESQELVAFIVGAALRYQLGDAGAERPRYAPVFLDEAFIKADARFAGRAVGAWRGLGFQLVVGAPLDKVSALEPHADVVLQAIKDATGRSRLVTLVGE